MSSLAKWAKVQANYLVTKSLTGTSKEWPCASECKSWWFKGHAEIKVFLSSLFNPNSPSSDHSSSLKNLVPPTSRLLPVNSLHSNLANLHYINYLFSFSVEIILRAEAVEQAQAGDKCDFTGTLIVVPDVAQLSTPGKSNLKGIFK